jgi:hypothetical protein
VGGRNASQLARAANVSVMSAFRFAQQLQKEGYLHESLPSLALVRRQDLFARWQAPGDRPVREVPMRFRLTGDPHAQLREVPGSGRACLALFAAADALQLGFVRGVPPCVNGERVQPSSLSAWKNLRPFDPGEPPDVVLRQAPAPQSIFRGMVRADDAAAQADLIHQRVHDPLIGKGEGGGWWAGSGSPPACALTHFGAAGSRRLGVCWWCRTLSVTGASD